MANLANIIPSEVMSALFVEKLRTLLVAGNVVNTTYAGTISAAGNSVLIPTLGDVTVSDYTKNQAVTYSSMDSSSQVLYVDQQKLYAVVVDKTDDAQAIKNIVPEIVNKGAYEMQKAADEYLLQTVMPSGALINGGTGVRAIGTSDTAITVQSSSTNASGAIDYIGRLSQRMDENDVPIDNRFIVCPPWFHNYLVKEKVLQTDGSVDANDAFANGRIGRVSGFDVRVSNNVTNASAAGSHILAGHMTSTSFVDKVIETSIKDLETKVGIGVRSVYIYGAKVVSGKSLCLGYITQGS